MARDARSLVKLTYSAAEISPPKSLNASLVDLWVSIAKSEAFARFQDEYER